MQIVSMQKGDTIMKTGASPKQTKKKISLKEKRTRDAFIYKA